VSAAIALLDHGWGRLGRAGLLACRCALALKN
jgi:hypothetical protein